MITRFGLLTAALAGLVATSRAPANDAPEPDLKPLLAEVRKLVTKHYPKAEVSLKDRTIYFQFHTRTFLIHEPLLTGEWQDAFETTGPQKGGVCGTLELRAGRYGGQAAAPQSFDKRYFTTLLLAPYSEKLDHHLYVHLSYPREVPDGLLEAFRRLADGFAAFVSAAGK